MNDHGHAATYDDLIALHDSTPEPTRRWFPVSHQTTIDIVEKTLWRAGFGFSASPSIALTRGDQRMYATITLNSEIAPGINLAFGVRNSTDQSLSLGACGGTRVFVCSNGAFNSDLIIHRKHTRFGERDYARLIGEAVGKLPMFLDQERERTKILMNTEISDELARWYAIEAVKRDVISTRQLLDVIRCYEQPGYREFRPRTLWSLSNAVTEILKPRFVSNPGEATRATFRLSQLLTPSAN